MPASFETFDFASDPDWRAYLNRVDLATCADEETTLRKLRFRWYKRNVDPNATAPGASPSPSPASSYSSSSSSSPPTENLFAKAEAQRRAESVAASRTPAQQKAQQLWSLLVPLAMLHTLAGFVFVPIGFLVPWDYYYYVLFCFDAYLHRTLLLSCLVYLTSAFVELGVPVLDQETLVVCLGNDNVQFAISSFGLYSLGFPVYAFVVAVSLYHCIWATLLASSSPLAVDNAPALRQVHTRSLDLLPLGGALEVAQFIIMVILIIPYGGIMYIISIVLYFEFLVHRSASSVHVKRAVDQVVGKIEPLALKTAFTRRVYLWLHGAIASNFNRKKQVLQQIASRNRQ